MPYSVAEGKDQTLEWVESKDIHTVLDVGPGWGTYYNLFRNIPNQITQIDGVEIWEPYIIEYDLKAKYNNIFLEDIRKWNDFNYDLVVFGDVLEHMSKEDAIEVWNKASKQARYGIISIPIIYLRQGEEHGNPYEEHVKDNWTTREVLDTFPHIVKHYEGKVVGVFFAEFGT